VPYTVPRLRLTLRSLLAAVTFLLVLSVAAPAMADDTENPNNMSCAGSIKKGAPDPDDADAGVIEYTVGCSGAIKGYSLISTNAVNAFETEVFGVDSAEKKIVASDLFSCGGDSPGFAVNCVGSTSWGWRLMTGTFSISGDVCAEPRTDVLLIAVAVSAAGKQSIAGPYDLGRPRGCPKTNNAGKNLFPADVLPTSRWGGPAATTVKATSKPKSKKAKNASKRKARRA